jgi:tetratricopeptide (TPR) repeat protein
MGDDEAVARPVVPVQVPVGLGRYVGRELQVSRVVGLLDDGATRKAPVVLVRGIPGVGKSALVCHAVELTSTRFPGGELYIDFADLDPDPATAITDALARCLRAFGVADAVMPPTLEERRSLFRSLTAVNPTLTVLDEVTDPAQVLSLLPKAAGSAVLVASTGLLSELVIDGAEVVPLEPLTETEGARMLAELSGRDLSGETAAVSELVSQCGGLPVALKVAALRLRRRATMTVETLVANIAEEVPGFAAYTLQGDGQVTAVFSVAYSGMTAAAARMYRSLAILPGPDFTADMAAVACDVGQDEGEELLEGLIEAGLLAESADGRLRLHGSVLRHARDRAKNEDAEADRTAALHRVVHWLVTNAACADRAVLGTGRFRVADHGVLLADVQDPFQGGGGAAKALKWLDAERANLIAAQRASAEHGWNVLTWQLAEAASALYVKRHYLVDWTESSKLGGQSARLCRDVRAEARLRSFGTRPWCELGQLAKAETELAESLPLAIETGDVRLIASVWELLGRFHDLGDKAKAAHAYATALELFGSVDDRRGVAFVSYFLGRSQLRGGEAEPALQTLRRALPLVRDVGDRRMEGRTLTDLAGALAVLGEDAAARSHLGEAIEILSGSGDVLYEADAQEALSRLSVKLGDQAAARAALGRAIRLHTSLGSPRTAELERRSRELKPELE